MFLLLLIVLVTVTPHIAYSQKQRYGVQVLQQSQSIITSIDATPLFDYLVSSTWSHQVNIYKQGDSSMVKFQLIQDGDTQIQSVCITEDGKTIFTGSLDGKIRVYKLSQNMFKLSQTILVASGVFTMDVNSDGTKLAAGLYNGECKIFKVLKGQYQEIVNLKEAKSTIFGVAWGDNILVTSSFEKSVRLYLQNEDIFTMNQQIVFDNSYVKSLDVSQKNNLYTGSSTGQAEVFRINNKMYIVSQFLNDSTQAITSVRVTGDSMYFVVAGNDNTARLYKKNSSTTYSLEYSWIEEDFISSVAIGQNSNLIATGSFDNKIRVYFECMVDNCDVCGWTTVCKKCQSGWQLQNSLCVQKSYVSLIVEILIIIVVVIMMILFGVFLIKRIKADRLKKQKKQSLINSSNDI